MGSARGTRRRRETRVVAASVAGALAVGVLAGCGGSPAKQAAACGTPTWVGTWSADPSDALNVGMVDQTSRTILTPHLGGREIRVRLSNRFGAAPVSFAAASVGLRRGAGADLVPGSRKPLTFGGAGTVAVPVGEDVVSDPVSLRIKPSSDLAVSVFVSGASGPATEHNVGQQTSYFSPPGSGDHSGDEGGAAFTLPTKARYFVSGVDVRVAASVGAVVALGDSITDGFGGPPDGNDRYPDFLARRLASPPAADGRLSVVNAGISGNHVLTSGPMMAGPSALDRLERDVTGEPGVSDVIVLEGINDIGLNTPADKVIDGLGQIVSRLHAAGLGVQLGTLTPFGGPAASPADTARQQVNQWIRGPSSGADGMIDFDAAVRDPADAERLAAAYDSGDHLHPSAAGRRAMAAAVDLAALRRASCRAG